MRNLKRALSLTLASVMLLGMMVVGAGAAGYKDVTDGHNVEAIEVLQAVGAMVGDEAGNFDPDANVNRAQIATIMSRLLDLKVEDFNAADIPFTDVPEWAVPFVAACYADGITSGVSATAYGSNNSVTAAQAALMMMKALGYFQYQDDFGDDWQLATIKQASEIGLFSGITVDRTSALTRNDVAQMALNALKSNMVSFTGEVGSVYEVNGTSIRVGYKPEYTIKTSADPIYNRIDNLATTIDKPTGQYEMQLGEYLYAGKLTLTSTVDVFGRPARYWELDGEEIGTYVKEELLKTAYTTSVTGKTLYDLLGSTTVKDYDFEITIDGVSDPTVFDGFDPKNSSTNKNEYWPLFNKTYLNRNNDASVGATGNGVLTQVFIDTNDKTVYIAVINTYLAFASEDYDEKNDLVDLEVHGITEIAGHKGIYAKASDSEQITVTAEEFDVASVADGDCFLVTVADGAIQSMRDPDVLSAVEISSFSKNSSLTTGGTKYDYASSLYYDPDTLEAWTDGKDQINLKDKTYNVYLDQYGYAIGVEEVESPDNYVFITGVNGNYNNLINVNVEANAIFLDGTMETISINGRKSVWVDSVSNEKLDLDVDAGATINRWFTYTKGSNGVYTVKLVDYGVKGLGQFHEDRDGEDVYGNGATPVDYKYHNVMVYDNKDRYETPVTDEKVVYSNDKTVFLTASVAELQTKAGVFSTVIDDVDGVAVGIDNVDITPWAHDTVKAKAESTHSAGQHNNTACIPHPTTVKGDNCNLSYGTYSLYNSKGYIIAMVVVGEDNGMADNLVYVDSGDVKSESYDKATEKWTWVRNAIVNGERVELVEVNDTGISLLEEMEPHHWYRVNYNANGEVTKVRSHKHTAPVPDWCYDNDTYGGYGEWGLNTGSYRYVHQYNVPSNAIYDAITTPGVDVVLYHQQHFQVTPVNDGHTLYMVTDKEQASGIRYTEDTNIVFIQTERNKQYTEFWKGETGVKKALKALHPLDKYDQKVSYGISALWKDGRATTIIIQDLNVQGQDGEWGQVRTGNVYFDATDSLDWAARMLAIYNERADITDQGRGRFYFELTGIDGFDIHDGRPAGTGYDADTILYRYKVYVNEEKDKNQVGREQTGVLYPIAGKPNHYWAEVPELPHTFNVDEELFIVITEVLNGIPNMPTRTNGTMPGNMDQPKIDGEEVPGSIGPAYPGQKVGFEIPVVTRAARAAGDRVEGNLVEGKPYRVEINGNTANPDPVYLVNGKLSGTYTITSEDISLGELVITGIYESEEGGTTPPTVDPTKPVSSVTVSPAVPASVKVGADLTFKVTSTGATGSVKVDTSKEGDVTVTLTVTTDNAKGFAAGIEVKDWTVAKYTEGAKTLTLTTTVKVESDGGPASGDIKVTIKPDENNEGQYVITVDANGKEPTDKELKKAINDEFKKQGLDVVVDNVMSGTAYDAEGKPVGTIAASVSYNVYVNGTLAGTYKKDAEGTKTFTQSATLAANLSLMDKTTGGVARGNLLDTDAFGELTASDITGLSLTEDLYLVNAYKLVISDGIAADVTWKADNDAEEKPAADATDKYFPEGSIITATGTAVTGGDRNKVYAEIGTTKTTPVAVTKDPQKYTFTVGTAVLNKGSKDTISVKETASTEVKVMFGGKTITTTETVTSNFTLPYAGNRDLVDKYLQVMVDSGNTTKQVLNVAGANVIEVAAVEGTNGLEIQVGALTSALKYGVKDGADYVLLPVAAVKFASTNSLGARIAYTKNGLNLKSDNVTIANTNVMCVPVGAVITLVNETSADNYRIMQTVGEKSTMLSEDKSASYTVVAAKDGGSDVPTFSLMTGINKVPVTGAVIGADPSDNAGLVDAVKNLVTSGSSMSVEAETTAINPYTTLSNGTGVKYTVTVTPQDGYYFIDGLNTTSTTELPLTVKTNADGAQTATFEITVTKGWS